MGTRADFPCLSPRVPTSGLAFVPSRAPRESLAPQDSRVIQVPR